MIFSKMVFRIICCCLLAFSSAALGQADKYGVTDVTFGMLAWIKHLNNDADKYFVKEKGEALNQHLTDLKRNLTGYMKARKVLSDSLFRNNITPGKKDERNLEDLKARMGTIMGDMRGVTDFVNDELRAEGDKLNDDIYNILYGEQPRFLSNLEAFLAGVDVTKRDMTVEGSKSYSRLEECVNLIAVLQDKLDRKMKK